MHAFLDCFELSFSENKYVRTQIRLYTSVSFCMWTQQLKHKPSTQSGWQQCRCTDPQLPLDTQQKIAPSGPGTPDWGRKTTERVSTGLRVPHHLSKPKKSRFLSLTLGFLIYKMRKLDRVCQP